MEYIYRNDNGQEMNYEDFKAYIVWRISCLVAEGISVDEATDILTSEKFFGDNIININSLNRLKQEIKATK